MSLIFASMTDHASFPLSFPHASLPVFPACLTPRLSRMPYSPSFPYAFERESSDFNILEPLDLR